MSCEVDAHDIKESLEVKITQEETYYNKGALSRTTPLSTQKSFTTL